MHNRHRLTSNKDGTDVNRGYQYVGNDGLVDGPNPSSAKLFKSLQTHILAFEAAIARLEELASENEGLGRRYQQVSLASLIREARTPADVSSQINRQLQVLEDHEKATIQTAHFATQEMQQIRELCPLMRMALEREMARMVENIYTVFYSTAHWSVHALAEQSHGRVPSAERIDDIVADLTLLTTWRTLSLKDESYCKNQIQYLRARKIQLRVLHLLEVNLIMATTHQSSSALRRDSDVIRSLVFGVFNPQGFSQDSSFRMDSVDDDFYFDPISQTWKHRKDTTSKVAPLTDGDSFFDQISQTWKRRKDASEPESDSLLSPSGSAQAESKPLFEFFPGLSGHDRRLNRERVTEGSDVGDPLEDREEQKTLGGAFPDLDFFNLGDDDDDDRKNAVGRRKRFRAKRRPMTIHVFKQINLKSALKKSGERRKDAPDHISFGEVEVEEY